MPQPQPVMETVRQVVQREVREIKALQQVTRTASETALVTQRAVVQQTQLVADTASAAPPATQSAPSAVEAPAVTHAKSVVEAVQGPEGAVQQASIKELPVRSAPSTRPDYGWLMDALWRQVDKLKRYPHTARVNRWEGQVVELSVEESSGYTVLDRDAVEILKQASPLKLKHPLGQPQVVVHVPISYTLH
jgi:protein TonB